MSAKLSYEASQLAKMIGLVGQKFSEIGDKGGRPYVLHCLQVMYNLGDHVDDLVRTAAVGHDIIEDTEETTESLLQKGFDKRVVYLIDLMTKKQGQTYEEYVNLLCIDIDAIKIKMADIQHNSEIRRLKGLSMKDFERMQKYHVTYKFLETQLELKQSFKVQIT